MLHAIEIFNNIMDTSWQVLVQVSVVPGFQQVKFSAPDMEDIFVDLPNTNDDSMMIHVEVKFFERHC